MRNTVTLAAFLCLSTCAGAQEPRPSFQTGTKLVLVPVVVRDRDGSAVSDLTRDSFQVFDKGKPQAVTSFSVERPAAGQPGATAERFTAWFFDDIMTSDTGTMTPLRDAALRSLAGMKAGDRVAIVSSSCRVMQDFTADRTKLQEAISKLQPAPVAVCRFGRNDSAHIALLRDVVRRMSVLPGAKGIVVISPGFSVPVTWQEKRDQLIDEAIQARITIHLMHIAGISSQQADVVPEPAFGQRSHTEQPTSQPDPGNPLRIAEGTGGMVIETGNSIESGFRQVETPACIYILGFVPDGKPDGTYHKLKVTVRDSRRLKTRAREGYYAKEAPATPAQAPPAVAQEARPAQPPVAASKLPEEAPERSSSGRSVVFRARASTVLIPVVVRDRDQHAAGNLRKEDFQLWDRGERQDITSFQVEQTVRASATPAPQAAAAPAAKPGESVVIPDRFTAYVFDDVHLRFADLTQVKKAVLKRIDDSMGPEDRVAVVTTSHRVVADFTGDRQKLRDAIVRVQPTPVYRELGPRALMSFLHAYKLINGDSAARSSGEKIVRDQGADAKFATLQPAIEMRSEAMARRVLQAGERETELSLHTLRDLSRRMTGLAGKRTIVFLSHGFLVTNSLQSELAETIDRAIRSGVVIHTFDTVGLWTGWEVEGRPGVAPYDDDTFGEFQKEARTTGGLNLEVIAEGTGGTAIQNSNDYEGGIRRLAAPPEYRYILGFAPRNLAADGSFHKVTIKLAKSEYKGFTLQSRRGYYAPKPAEGLSEAAAKEIETAVFARDEVRDLPLEMRTEVSHAEGAAAALMVIVEVNLPLLHYRKAGDRNVNDVTVVSAVFDNDGNFIAGKQQDLKLRLRDETMANLEQQKPETFQTSFDLSPGAYLVRMVAYSAEGHTIAATSKAVQVP